MSDDIGVKAPVTRLRRRLSIESEEVKSPAGTTTPTKKKGGRLATKPQLDLIEEIDAEQVPKRSTRKTAVKDIETVEEKPLTPSRRSARIRSNTSILSETPQALDSPRAKRAAARRTSLAGSDNDAPVTPARVTRRTRKDSTSSIDKPVDKVSTKTSAATEVIVEEQEANTNESDSKNKSINKSPKLKGKRGKKNDLSKSSNETEEDIENVNDLNNSTDKENQVITDVSVKSVPNEPTQDSDKKDSQNNRDNIVECNEIITENFDAKPKNNSSILHKSTSAIEDSKSFKSKRHRTMSVSVIPTINTNDCSFFSDTEISKKKRKNKSLTIHSSDAMFVQDSEGSKKSVNRLLATSHDNKKKDDTQNTSISSKKSIEMDNDIEIKPSNTSKNITVNEDTMTGTEESTNSSILKTGWKKNIINQIQTESKVDSEDKSNYISPIKCFEHAPSKNLQSVVILDEDSDSNVGMNDNNIHPVPYLDSEDQCVPVVKHGNQNDNCVEIPHDNSYEPMDIDESIQQNTSINKSLKSTPKSPNEMGKKNQSLVSMDQSDDCNKLNPNKTKRKSSISSFETHNDKSTCESKSTLILSQIKDMSSNENDKNSPKGNNKEQLSKSINVPDNINKEISKKKLSLDYSTSTPLQQKAMKKLGLPIDTSLISPKNSNKDIMRGEKSESKKQSNFDDDNDMDQTDESEEEITKTQNEIIDDEAEEASEDYQSGDSQDEDERQYEEQNRIVEKGETLDSEEEFSDDTDYEKDSFVVSSDEEDNDLLSGSGDDLSMSDNELSMSTKSKKKYNEKKIKEQKKASREMYESRHKLLNSKKSVHNSKSKKNNRQRLDSSSSDSDEEVTVQTKKNNRQRIDSSHDLSEENSDANQSLIKKDKTKQKKKQKHLSESICDEDDLNEQEITIFNESKLEEKDPISISIKHEPKTPQKGNNLSAIAINENIEEVDVDQNKSISKPNETSDPLQATMLDVDENSSSGEENKEIMKNYNSVLETLNSKPAGNKSHNISLNTDKKQKKVKEAIIDQLNLTQSKSKKFIKKSIEKESSEDETHAEKEQNTSIDKDDDDTSDSINMRLLFTEESNDSETPHTDNMKEVSAKNINKDREFIPLKESKAKTNLLEDMGTELNNSSQLNENKKLNHKRHSAQNIPEENSALNDTKNNELNFFIDTTGTRDDQEEEQMNESLSASSKKKKKRNSECTVSVEDVGIKTPKKSLDTEMFTAAGVESESAKTPLSEKKTKKGKKSLNAAAVDEKESETQNEIVQHELTVETRTPQSGKKKIKSGSSLEESENIQCVLMENDQDTSLDVKSSNGKKNKKTKQSLTGMQNEEVDETNEVLADENEQEASFNILMTSDKKKKKTKPSLNSTQVEEVDETSEVPAADKEQETSINIFTTSDKKKKKAKQSLNSSQVEEVHEISKVPAADKEQETSFNIFTTSDKKKKKAKQSLSGSQVEHIDENSEVPVNDNGQETSFNIFTTSEKKKKKAKQSLNGSQVEEVNEISKVPAADKEQETSFNIFTTSDKKKKKAKQSLTGSQVNEVDITNEELAADNDQEISFNIFTASDKKKKKTKQSLTSSQVEQVDKNSEVPADENEHEASFNVLTTSDKKTKKQKKSLSNMQNEQVEVIDELHVEENPQETSFDILTNSHKKKKKTKKSLNDIENEQVIETSKLPTEVIQQINIKRLSSQPIDSANDIPLEVNNSGDEAPLEIIYQSNKNKIGAQLQLSETAIDDNIEIGSKKRKRKHSALIEENAVLQNVKENDNNDRLNVSSTGRQTKKRKINNNMSDLSVQDKDDRKDDNELTSVVNNKPTKLNKNKYAAKQENIPVAEKAIEKTNHNKKRKERDDDDITNVPKMLKQSSFNKAQVTRLPSHILKQLGDKPNKIVLEAKKAKVVSTTKFTVENTRVRRNKPSNYLEESVYLNDDTLLEKKQKYSIKKPKVLPFIPTASTSDKGFTTNFRINVLPVETQFVAQATNVTNFKKDFLQQQKMKKFHTFEKYKNQRNVKLSKF